MTSLENKGKKPKKSTSNISLTTLGWELALPIFGGVLLGYHIDNNTPGSGYTFTFLLLVIGIFVGYYNLYKYIHLELLRTKLSNRKFNKEEHS